MTHSPQNKTPCPPAEGSLLCRAGRHAAYIRELCGVDCCVYQVQAHGFAERPPAFCERHCPHYNTPRCTCASTHFYGCVEAQRWCGKYIYYCPAGLIFSANALPDAERRLAAGIICGPVVMTNSPEAEDEPGELAPDLLALLPRMSTQRVRYLSELLGSVCGYLGGNGAVELVEQDQQKLHNNLYDMSRQYQKSGPSPYPINTEKQLQHLIATGNKAQSQQLLNQLLGHIYFHSEGDFETIRARAIELIVILSRATIDSGGDLNQIFWLNTAYLKEIEQLRDLEGVNRLLTHVLHRFISCAFDFDNVKHVDVLYKTIDYIKEHCSEKITLDDLAEAVHLSKSYLSHIFKDELHCTFTSYVNRLRIQKSKAYLLNDKLSLAEIAMLSGFEDQSYFTKVFKKATGVSPGKFRELRGNIVPRGE